MKIEHIEQWIGRDVLDGDGEKVGKLSEVHFDGDRPVVGEISTGRISKKQHLVPLREASATRDDLRVPYPKDTITAVGGPAPDGSVTHEELAAVAQAYGVHLGVDDGPRTLEGSKAREARLAAAAAALARAEELEREAALRAEETQAAEERAREAADAVEQARAAQRSAERAAAEARAQAGPAPATTTA
ncbi:hypothetical protein GKE82_07420 [Conexibacter sp. W3-3-2]|uniref:PRC-barrel domain-containing protein n=1 Tax=Paraconexibacter algicola TaxID=2133960 RepID=A0A2T4UMU0_9ACTN|nr:MULTISPECIES: PRC-barrel domain-containing protein [Solirubrobacterales]MTD44134.1 hypothetical protein [Conexibacter sp. W3-3-2]PTL60539.1 hypothetical protein C7Y72_13270 [Paraconexibacter algicola]